MKRFVWRLQRVLDIKAKEEQVKRAELFELTEKLARVRSELVMQKKILRDLLASIREKKPRNRLAEQEFFLRCSPANDELIKKLKGKVSELELRQREKIAEVLKIRQFKEGLEKLRTEAKMRFIREQEKLEQKELDEGATICFARKVLQQAGIGREG